MTLDVVTSFFFSLFFQLMSRSSRFLSMVSSSMDLEPTMKFCCSDVHNPVFFGFLRMSMKDILKFRCSDVRYFLNIVASQKCGFKEEIYRWRALLRSTHKCFFNSNQNMDSPDNHCGVWSGMGGKQSFYYKSLKACSSHFAFEMDITRCTDRSRFCGSSSTKFGHVVHFGVFSHVFDTRQNASRGSAGSCERPS
jgi:hypothetical protein